MIVSQADYDRWQNMYGNSRTTGQDSTTAQASTASLTETLAQPENRQKAARNGEKSETDGTSIAASDEHKSFLEEAFERLTLNRLGVDQEKMDELKDEIEKTESAIDALSDQKPHTEAQKKELNHLKDKLEKLREALEELVKQANERANKEDIAGQKNAENSVNQYKSIAFMS